MQNIEQAAELHAAIECNAPHPGAIYQSISSARGWATNQEAQSLAFTSRVAPTDVDGEARRLLVQGFGCVEISITARWGGCNHDGSTREGTEVDVHVLDRLNGGMAQRSWHTRGVWRSAALTDADVIPLMRSLLGMEPLETIKARQDSERENNASEMAAWNKSWGLDH